MSEISFTALGTTWAVIVDDENFSPSVEQAVVEIVATFEATYSRFKPESWLSQLNASQETTVEVLPEFAQMLAVSLQLRDTTDGAFDINSAAIHEAYGYDKDYSFKNANADISVIRGQYWLEGTTLHKQGNVRFDLGAVGKGFVIDKVAQVLKQHGVKHFLVDGGRDFMASSKHTGEAWNIALEHPLHRDQAIGILPLKDQALACSSSHHRRVGKYHHIVNATTAKPVDTIAALFLTAENAFLADALSTAIFVSQAKTWEKLQQHFAFEYLVLYEDMTLRKSSNFPGEVFSRG